MKVKKVVFTWENIDKGNVFLGNMQRLDIVFGEDEMYPIIYIDAGNIKIEDRSLELDAKEVLKKIGEIDFEMPCDLRYPNNYSGDIWKLQVNDKEYEGMLEDPHYIVRIKKIIRFNAIQVYANKKLAGYIKN